MLFLEFNIYRKYNQSHNSNFDHVTLNIKLNILYNVIILLYNLINRENLRKK